VGSSAYSELGNGASSGAENAAAGGVGSGAYGELALLVVHQRTVSRML
jgi:hypothetical protein